MWKGEEVFQVQGVEKNKLEEGSLPHQGDKLGGGAPPLLTMVTQGR
jgi:hypothetical protein